MIIRLLAKKLAFEKLKNLEEYGRYDEHIIKDAEGKIRGKQND